MTLFVFMGDCFIVLKKKKRDAQSLYALKENFLGASVVVGLIKRLVIWEGELKTDMIDHQFDCNKRKIGIL